MKNSALVFEVPAGVQASKFIAFYGAGLLTALRDGYVPLNEVERFFLPRMVNSLEGLGVDSEVVDLVRMGCELEDIESLAPDRLEFNIAKLLEGFLMYLSRGSFSEVVDIKIP